MSILEGLVDKAQTEAESEAHGREQSSRWAPQRCGGCEGAQAEARGLAAFLPSSLIYHLLKILFIYFPATLIFLLCSQHCGSHWDYEEKKHCPCSRSFHSTCNKSKTCWLLYQRVEICVRKKGMDLLAYLTAAKRKKTAL